LVRTTNYKALEQSCGDHWRGLFKVSRLQSSKIESTSSG